MVLVPLEAVSPILCTDFHWERDIDKFWSAFGQVFHMPDPSRLCGSHVHVSPKPSREFNLRQLQSIAFGTIYYENEVIELLPWYRQNNKYCQLNTVHSRALYRLVHQENLCAGDICDRIKRMDSKLEIRNCMQRSDDANKDRYVLWNFDNVLPGRSGTVEFRGGRGLRGPVRTKRWMAFAVAFFYLCISQVS